MTNEAYTKERPLRVVTLCSGYDSQCMALERLKRDFPGFDYDCIAWAEIDRYAIQAHDAVFPQYRDRNMGDITSCDWTKITQPIDLMIYSTPCTSISNAGKREGLKKGSGTASSIIWSVLNAIDTLNPKYLLMENVKAFVSKKFMPDFRDWYNELASRGYQNFWKVLNAKDYRVPQNRERVFMVSILDENASFHFPEPFHLERRLKDILEEDVDERYYLSDKCVKGFMEHNRRHQEKGTGILCRPKSGEDIGNAVRANGAICPTDNVIMEPVIAASQGRNPESPSDRTAGIPTEQALEIGGGVSNTLTSVQKDNVVIEPLNAYGEGVSRTIKAQYYKTGRANLIRNDSRGATGVIEFARPVCLNSKVDGKQPSLEHRVYDCGGNSTAVTTGFMPKIAVPTVPTPKRNEYGKSVRKKYEAGEIQESRHNMTDLVPRKDGICNTITTLEKDNLLIEPSIVIGSTQRNVYVGSTDGVSPCVNAACGKGVGQTPMIIQAARGKNKGGEHDLCPTISSNGFEYNNMLKEGSRIRKLTPRECFRLMDVSEEDIDRIQAAGISRNRQYKMAGNSICVNVLYHIFRKLFIDKENENSQLTLF